MIVHLYIADKTEHVAGEALSMGLIAVTLAVAAFTWITSFVYRKVKYIYERISALQGPVSLPFVGNLHQFHFKPEGRTIS